MERKVYIRHLVKYEDFKDEIIEHTLASSAGREGSKRLVVLIKLSNVATHYEVIKNGRVDYETSILERAVDHYNFLP